MKKSTPTAILALTFLGATGLHAQTVVQSADFEDTATYSEATGSLQFVGSSFFSANFTPFDQALGTLDSFVIEWTLDNAATGNLGPAGGSLSMSLAGNLELGGTAYRFGVTAGDGTGGPPNAAFDLSAPVTASDTFLVSAAGADYDSALLSAVTGEASFSLSYLSGINFSVGSGSATFDASTSGEVSLTYHYTPIPEPSAYALLLGLFAASLAASRRPRD